MDARRETLGLLTVIAVIVLLMIARFGLMGEGTPEKYVRPYQRIDNILVGAQRTLYRSLLSVVDEVVDLRDQEGLWPVIELLEMESIPPFDNSFLPVSLKNYVWEAHDGNSWVDYVGQNPAGDEPVTFILRIIDLYAEYHPHPHPGIDYDPNMRVAAQVWIYPESARPYPGERLPEAGWWWVVSQDDPSLRAESNISDTPSSTTPGATP